MPWGVWVNQKQYNKRYDPWNGSSSSVILLNRFFWCFFLKVIDISTGKSLGLHKDGEICTRGATVMVGYLNQPDATASTIDKDGWLHTGGWGTGRTRMGGYTLVGGAQGWTWMGGYTQARGWSRMGELYTGGWSTGMDMDGWLYTGGLDTWMDMDGCGYK